MVRSPVRSRRTKASSCRRVKAPCSSTRSASSRFRFRQSCCACFRNARSSNLDPRAGEARRPPRDRCDASGSRSGGKGRPVWEDLYYRLNVVELTVPSATRAPRRYPAARLRVRAKVFGAIRPRRQAVQLAPELVEYLEQQPWPGNVRQLENVIARCVALATTQTIGRDALSAPTDGIEQRGRRSRRRSRRPVIQGASRSLRAQPADQGDAKVGRQPGPPRAGCGSIVRRSATG